MSCRGTMQNTHCKLKPLSQCEYFSRASQTLQETQLLFLTVLLKPRSASYTKACYFPRPTCFPSLLDNTERNMSHSQGWASTAFQTQECPHKREHSTETQKVQQRAGQQEAGVINSSPLLGSCFWNRLSRKVAQHPPWRH